MLIIPVIPGLPVVCIAMMVAFVWGCSDRLTTDGCGAGKNPI